MNEIFQLFPEQASTMADDVDRLFFFLLAVSGFFVVLICALIAFFSLRYRRREYSSPTPTAEATLKIELIWTIIPLIITIIIFIWSARVYARLITPPEDALEIYVVGKQWMWKIQHPQGRSEINELHVPIDRPIKLTMASQDVIHSFFVPAFRVKHDVIPGRFSSMWFEATKLGEYRLYCAEYCGDGHSEMIGRVVVMKPEQYQAWLAGSGEGEPLAQAGKKLFDQLGCAACHGTEAPTMAGLFGSEVRLADGRTVIADNHYIRESILDSTVKIVAGYDPIMPSYQNQVSEEQLIQLLAYIKSLSEPAKVSPPQP